MSVCKSKQKFVGASGGGGAANLSAPEVQEVGRAFVFAAISPTYVSRRLQDEKKVDVENDI
jgi:hypothetical protein